MKHLALLLSLIQILPVPAAFADTSAANEACKNSISLDQHLFRIQAPSQVKFGELCRKQFEGYYSLDSQVQARMPRANEISVDQNLGQAGAVGRVSEIQSQAGAANKAKAEVAAQAEAQFKKAGEASEASGAAVKKHYEGLSVPAKQQIHTVASASVKEFQAIRDANLTRSRDYGTRAVQFRSSSGELTRNSEESALRARQMAGGDQLVGQQTIDKQFVQNQYVNDKKTVSSDTWVGLGGAALITAGAVGGLYLVGNKLVKKGDKAAEARITQAEDSANRVIKNAEETAKRIVEFAVSSAGKIITNVEEAAKRIYEKAKEDVQKLIGDLTDEVKAQFKNLSTEGLKKLRGEFESMFAGLIEKAKQEGNSALVTSLTNAWTSLATTIDTEIASRVTTATSSSTSTSTASATSSSTGTNTTTSSSTSTSTSSKTSSSSSTSTSTSTSSATSTKSSSATYTGTYTSNRM